MGIKTVPEQFPVAFAPGDQVVHYVDGQPFFCTVVAVEADERVRVRWNSWPRGYGTVVSTQELALVSRAHLRLKV